MQETFPNGWTFSYIRHGYGASAGLFEGWAWHEDGRSDPEPRGWLTRAELDEYRAEVMARDSTAAGE